MSASDRGLAAWLDEQIAEAEGQRREVEEDFPDGERPNDADLAYAREKALREVRERLADGGESEEVIEGRDETCPTCQATVGTSLAYVLDEHTWSIEDGPGSENPPMPCGASEVAVHYVLAASPARPEGEAGDAPGAGEEFVREHGRTPTPAEAADIWSRWTGWRALPLGGLLRVALVVLTDYARGTHPASPPTPEGEAGSSAGSAELYERLAAIEHERWASWQRYLHSKCTVQIVTDPDPGALVIPSGYVANLWRLIDTPYADLTEREKASDREQVDRYWHLVTPSPAGPAQAEGAGGDR